MEKKILSELTSKIIMICKHQSIYTDGETHLDNIKQFMSDRSGMELKYFSDDIMDSIITEAVLNYIECCDNPRFFMWQFFDSKKRESNYKYFLSVTQKENFEMPSDFELFCRIFSGLQVREPVEGGYNYINGFTHENTQFVNKPE